VDNRRPWIGPARTFVTILAVFALVALGILYLLREGRSNPRFPHRIGGVAVLGTLVDVSGQWADIQASDGTISRLERDQLIDTSRTVYAPQPGVLPDIGDLVLTTVINEDRYFVIAGDFYGCQHAVKFAYAFDETHSIVGAALGGLGEDRSGFRLAKAAGFEPTDRPDYAGRWYDYYVVFCVNDDGEAVTAWLIG
jgi:hypothetical protein